MLTRSPFPALRFLEDFHRTADPRHATCCSKPAFDIKELEDHFEILGDVPGMTAQDVAVKVERDQLLVTGTRKPAEEPEGAKYLWREREFGGFERRYQLHELVETEKITAQVRDGQLRVVLPKKEALKPKEIAIQVQA